MLWVVVNLGDHPGHLQWMLAPLPVPIPTIPKTRRPATTDRPRTPMLWRSKQHRASSRISHFPRSLRAVRKPQREGNQCAMRSRQPLVDSATRLTRRVPWLCVPSSRRVCHLSSATRFGHRVAVKVNWLHRRFKIRGAVLTRQFMLLTPRIVEPLLGETGNPRLVPFSTGRAPCSHDVVGTSMVGEGCHTAVPNVLELVRRRFPRLGPSNSERFRFAGVGLSAWFSSRPAAQPLLLEAGCALPVRSRCEQPGQQQGRRMPSSSSSLVRRMRRSRVFSCFASSTQQMNSLRASGVMSFQAWSAVGFAISVLRRSAGSLCTTPPGSC